MRSVPAFVITCHPHRAARAALASLAALSLGMGAWWAARHLLPDETTAVALAVPSALLAALAAWRLSDAAPARLRWDGSRWLLGAPSTETPGSLSVRIDMAGWMLLCFNAGRRETWLTVTRAGTPESWHPLRCALYAPTQGARRPRGGPADTRAGDDRP